MVFPVVLTGPHLRLRELDVDRDFEAVFAMQSDERVTRYTMIEGMSRTRERELLDGFVAQSHARERAQYDLVAESLSAGEILGMGRVVVDTARAGVGEIGYVLREAVWGRGFGTEVARLLVAFGFESLHLHRIAATVHPDNRASQRVLEHAGMVREGHLRDYAFVRGAWRDALVYAVLEHDWDRDSR